MLMPGSLASSAFMPASPFAVSPSVFTDPTMRGSPSLMPKPLRNPWWRCSPLVIPGARSSIAILGSLPCSVALAFAYRPISSPACRLSVANSASTAVSGLVGVSSAITVTPARRAFSIAGTTAVESAGVIRMPFAPSEVIFSRAATWLALSMSLLPAAVRSFTLSSSAVSFATSCIRVQNGFVSRLTMSPSVTFGSSEPPQEATPSASAAAHPSTTRAIDRRRRRRGMGDSSLVRALRDQRAAFPPGAQIEQRVGRHERQADRRNDERGGRAHRVHQPALDERQQRAAQDGHDEAGSAELRVLAEPLQGDAVDGREHQRQRRRDAHDGDEAEHVLGEHAREREPDADRAHDCQEQSRPHDAEQVGHHEAGDQEQDQAGLQVPAGLVGGDADDVARVLDRERPCADLGGDVEELRGHPVAVVAGWPPAGGSPPARPPPPPPAPPPRAHLSLPASPPAPPA